MTGFQEAQTRKTWSSVFFMPEPGPKCSGYWQSIVKSFADPCPPLLIQGAAFNATTSGCISLLSENFCSLWGKQCSWVPQALVQGVWDFGRVSLTAYSAKRPAGWSLNRYPESPPQHTSIHHPENKKILESEPRSRSASWSSCVASVNMHVLKHR